MKSREAALQRGLPLAITGIARGASSWAAIVSVLAGLLPLAPGRAEAASPPRRILLVSVDGLGTASADSMQTLAAISANGARAEGRSPATVTFPALAALLSGRGPVSTGVRGEDAGGLPRTGATLAASLAGLGYQGFALPADYLAHAGSGIGRGFERFDAGAPARTDSARADSAVAWLARPGKRFAWLGLSFGEARAVWRREDGPRFTDPDARKARARAIDGAIAYLMAGLEHSRLVPGTLLVLVGTHGLRGDSDPRSVPIAFVRTGERASRSLSGTASLVDVAPTLVQVAGGVPKGFDGRPILDRTSPAPARAKEPAAQAASPCRIELASLLGDDMSVPDSIAIVRFHALAARCSTDRRLAIEEADALSRANHEEKAAKLFEAVGKRWHGDPENAIAYGQHLIRYKRYGVMPRVIASVPPGGPLEVEAAWLAVAGLAGELRFGEAARAAREAAALAVPSSSYIDAAESMDSLRATQTLEEHNPDDPMIQIEYGRRLGEAGLMDPAYEHFHRARSNEATRAEADYWIGTYLMREGRLKPAAATLERALQEDSTLDVARVRLAEALVGLDRWKEAIPLLQRVVAKDPKDGQAGYNLACLLARDGQTGPALDALRKALAVGYGSKDQLARDPDLDSLRSLPEFQALLAAQPGGR